MGYLFPVNANKNVVLDLKDKKIHVSVGFALVHLVEALAFQSIFIIF